ncbi:3',5'-cyclic-nucleotide phosphodiesterase [Undibacterium sp. Tian12W]|uniref:3',5'-cyclic-nucleotide phosphodiesterase n=1 Tax=Undibacterium sp. Tian12W TaxID=3413054 RepID=UPI003BF05172
MNLQILGCAGGIGGSEPYTTSLLIDDDILLDAGTGLSRLSVEQLVAIDHVFISHSHLDHVAGLTWLMDAVFGKRDKPVTVHATAEVLHALKTHIFNWIIWPDFSTLPDTDKPSMQYQEMLPGSTLTLGDRLITSHVVDHVPGSVAYWVRAEGKGFLFTGDMASTPALWENLTGQKALSMVIVDCSFPNAEVELALVSKHFCPAALINDIAAVSTEIDFHIYHLKPGQEAQIMAELGQNKERNFKALKMGEQFSF